MVNSKKMSKSSIAVIVLSILLVLSMILGLTGAWFTDKEDNSAGQAINMGKVEIELSPNENGAFAVYRKDGTTNVNLASQKVMPGDILKVELGVAPKSETEDFWFVVLVTMDSATKDGVSIIGNEQVAAAKTALEANNAKLYCTAAGAQNGTSHNVEKYNSKTEVTLDGAAWGNALQGAIITLKYEVRAIQYTNVDADEAYNYLNTNYDPSAFAAGTGALSA